MPYTHMQTYIGSVIVSVNPYKQIGIYDNDTMEEYRGVNFYELSPHMWVLPSWVAGWSRMCYVSHLGMSLEIS